MRIALDGTNALVAAGVLLIVGAGAWLVVGTFLVWALWQLAVFYVVLVLVAVAVYGTLFLAVGRGDGESARDRVIGE